MRIPPARIANFLHRPGESVRAVLLYGSDAGLVRERADLLARGVCDDLNDPFRVADLSAAVLAADPARLVDEAAQLSFLGGRRVVRVRAGGDGLARLFQGFLEDAPGDTLVLVEAGDLPGSSALRRTFDTSPRAAAIGCYVDGTRERAALVRETLSAHRISITRDAMQYLVEHLGADRRLTRSELEKLALYTGEGGRVELGDARLSVSDSAALDLDDAVLAAAEGDAARLERTLGLVFQQGDAPVTVIRAMLRHLQRLHVLTGRVSAGTGVDEVLRTARPPVFYKYEDSFRRQLGLWSETRLRDQLDRVAEAEARMKTTGLPAETICRATLARIALAAAAG